MFWQVRFSELYNYNLGNPLYWDWKEDYFPPTTYAENIVIGEGITAIGDYMFINSYNVKKLLYLKVWKESAKPHFWIV